MKILKSFETAHQAVQWMNANKIEGTSIETTPVLKSIGYGNSNVSNGNYHVVLKSEGKFTPNKGDALLDSVTRLAGGGPVTPAHIKAAAEAHGITDESLHEKIHEILTKPEFQPDPTHDMLAAAAQTSAIREALEKLGQGTNAPHTGESPNSLSDEKQTLRSVIKSIVKEVLKQYPNK